MVVQQAAPGSFAALVSRKLLGQSKYLKSLIWIASQIGNYAGGCLSSFIQLYMLQQAFEKRQPGESMYTVTDFIYFSIRRDVKGWQCFIPELVD